MTPDRIKAVLDAADDETKIAIVAWTFKHLVEHAMHGGTLRQLVYDRLKLPMAAYTPLILAGGITIVSRFELQGREPTVETCRVPAELTDAMRKKGRVMLRKLAATGPMYDDAILDEFWAALLLAHKADSAARG